MASYMDLKGTTRSTFQVEKGGPLLKNNSSILEARNTTDSAYSDFKCDTLDVADPSGSRTNLGAISQVEAIAYSIALG